MIWVMLTSVLSELKHPARFPRFVGRNSTARLANGAQTPSAAALAFSALSMPQCRSKGGVCFTPMPAHVNMQPGGGGKVLRPLLFCHNVHVHEKLGAGAFSMDR